MSELIKPFPSLADLNHLSSLQHYPFIADIETETARVALVGVGGHNHDSGHPQYPLLDTTLDRFAAQASAQEQDVICYFEGGPRPPSETSPDIPAEDAIARHAECGWLIRTARENDLAAESWDLPMSDGIDALMPLYRGDPVPFVGDYQLPKLVHELWSDEQTVGSWLGYHHFMKHRSQWLNIKKTKTDPGDFLPYALGRLEAHGAIEAFRRNDIDITDMTAFEAIHKAVCTEAKVDEKRVPLNPQDAPEETDAATYRALHVAPFSRFPRRADELTKLQYIGDISDSVLRNLHLTNLMSRMLAENTHAFVLTGGWHAYHAADYLRNRGQQVERTAWHLGISACQDAFKSRALA